MVKQNNRSFFLTLLFLLLSIVSHAQENSDIRENAFKYDQENLGKLLPTLEIVPHYLDDYPGLWFGVQSPEYKGWKYFFVETGRGKIVQINNVERLAVLLREHLKKEIASDDIRFPMPGKSFLTFARFSYEGISYCYNPLKNSIRREDSSSLKPLHNFTHRPIGEISPDKQWVLYNKGYNLFITSVQNKEYNKQLSFDGTSGLAFLSQEISIDSSTISVPSAKWYGDSGMYYAIRKDVRGIGKMSVMNSLTQPRPRLITYTYETPGDTVVSTEELFVGKISDSIFFRVDVNKWEGQTLEVIPMDKSGMEVFFIRKNRTRDEMELCAVNIYTGRVRIVINEKSKPFINEDLFNVRILDGGKYIVWWSDRTGWGQYYLYDGQGNFLNPITAGNWTAGKILHFDKNRSELYLMVYGVEKDVNPNYGMLYSCSLNGKNSRLLTQENADHKIYMSPDGNSFIDIYSRIDLEPITLWRSTRENLSVELYRPNLAALYNYGWKKPELFQVFAKDDSTKLYGIMWKPFHFTEAKTYPIISQVYPGPQTETVWTRFTVLDRYNNTSLANMGNIVVCMGHRGGTPYRSAAYYKFGYGNLRDYAIDDDKYGLEQLITRFSFIDSEKVGITGHSGGGMMAVAALGKYPDFYKVAVASAGNHDNRIYNRTWGETYEGLTPNLDSTKGLKFTFHTDLNQELAHRIKGSLLLVTGESDENVNPAATMRMADAMIRANKDFEMLVLPGQSHSYEGVYKKYYERKQQEFFYRKFFKKVL